MKRKDLAKRSLALLLATSMALSSSLTVMADDTDIVSTDHENTIEVYDGLTVEVFGWSIVDHDSDDFSGVNSKDAQYHDNEAAKVEDNSASVQYMEAQVKIAQDAANGAKEAVEDLDAAIKEANTQTETAATEAGKTTIEAANATTAATDAKNAVNAVNSDIEVEADKYNNKVANDQTAVDAIENKTAATESAVSIADINTPSTEDSSVAQIVADTKAKAAEAAAEAAKAEEALKNALAVETDVVNGEVEGYVKEAGEAAINAKKAADDAEKIYINANKALTDAIAEYNLYAMMYGEPLYGKTEKTYTDDEAKKALVEAEMMDEDDKTQAGICADLAADKTSIDSVDLSSYETAINTAEQNLGTAESNFNEAKAAADTALTNINTAVATIEQANTDATDAFNKVADYYVSPANEALETTKNNIEAKTEEKTQKETALSDAKEAATPAAEKKYNDTATAKETAKNTAYSAYEAAQAEYEKAYEEYDDIPKWKVVSRGIAYLDVLSAESDRDDAKDNYDTKNSEYNTYVAGKDNHIATYISEDAGVIQANTNLTNVNSELNALNSTKTSQEATLAQAEATKAAYLAAYQNKTQEQFRKEIADAIKPLSDEINQTEYDKVVNDFVNDSWNSWEILTKGIIRDQMNDMYEEYWGDRFINALAATQWIHSTENADEIIATTQADCKKAIENYLENLCMAEANWAADSAAASSADKNTLLNTIDLVATQNTLNDAVAEVNTAKGNLNTAKTTLSEAQSKLATLQDQVKYINLNNINLDAINAKLQAAKAAVADAKVAVDNAKASQAAAENYAAWASSLLEKQQMVVYSEITGETSEEPEFTPVFTADDDATEVPYSIYRAYVDAMYKEYTFGQQSDKTIITPENMKVLFWELDANGNLTGVYYDDESKLPASGRYFVGYAFGYDKETYRLEGKMYDYVKPSNGGNVPGEPEGDVPGEPQGPDDYTPVPVNGRPGSTSNADALAAYYAALAAMNNGNGGNVLGVNRQERAVAAPEAEVLGEKKDTENTIIDEKKNVAGDDKPVVKIEDTPVPLANSLTEEEKAGMSWWWLLLVAVLGTAGVVAYREHQKKKAVVETESKKNNKKTNAK